jgi:SET domain-containing protein
MKSIAFLHAALVISKTKGKGRGVFCTAPLPADIIIEIAPVIIMSGEDRKELDKTLLHDYIFEWGEDRKQCCMALGYVPLYNHSFASNCEYEMDFKKEVIRIKTVREIALNEELFINYNGDWNNKALLWFPAK